MVSETFKIKIDDPKITRDRLERLIINVLEDPDLYAGYYGTVEVIE